MEKDCKRFYKIFENLLFLKSQSEERVCYKFDQTWDSKNVYAMNPKVDNYEDSSNNNG